MSEFAKHLTMYKTNRHHDVISPICEVMTVREDYDRIVPLHAIEYVIQTQLAAKVLIMEEAIESNPKVLEYSTDKAKHDLIEALFGEFRENFRELRQHAYKTADHLLLQKISKFEERMYAQA